MDEIGCKKCHWSGMPDELVCSPEDEDKPVSRTKFNRCPRAAEATTLKTSDDFMRLKLINPGLRSDWKNNQAVRGILLEKDLQIGSSRLRAKLLVFTKTVELTKTWLAFQGSYLGPKCRGAVNGLFREVIDIKPGKPERHWIEADPRYFCVIGLVEGFLTMEIICHESVHAAFNYVKRIKRSPWDKHAKDFDEEEICYPAGQIGKAIVAALTKAKMI